MTIIELILLSVALAMDAFAVSVCTGLTMKQVTLKKAAIVGGYFGFFQALMPLIGYILASRFAHYIEAFDHWIAFALLAFLGIKLIHGALQQHSCDDRTCPAIPCQDRHCPKLEQNEEASLTCKAMFPLAIATSIDALAVGITFAFIQVNIFQAITSIGIITFIISMIGVKLVMGLDFV